MNNVIEGEQEHHLTEKKQQEKVKTITNISVSFDGSWPTRGHRSKHGIGCVIDVETGFVIDFDIMTKFCQLCVIAASKLGENTADYETWQQRHVDFCQQNHSGSSAAMETSVAEIIWKRSEDYGFRFTTMLSDGDSKTFNFLQNLNVYGPELQIRKEECINHVGKR
ncbi:hypothetical protein ALC57_00113 [Trachymyrmex cornetzi]|uniref:Mutator-like transposase domain-containing protein n=1 Tax=Trachymyrmex cornetzi TaxID=471704 RepID=A0A151K2X6_9HYME|nr:hypothetical protein ALC57_00113 [Trachymyrmex cornetzi]